jgi:hypothetical protein
MSDIRNARKEFLARRYQQIVREIEQKSVAHCGNVRLIAVSKYFPDEDVVSLAALGQVDFAESRPQALRDRAGRFPELAWHMIGPLQRNKAKYVGRFAHCWHSVEDVETAQAVARFVQGRRLPVLLQVNVAGEVRQHGVRPDALPDLYEAVSRMPELEVIGLMCLAPKTGDARSCFRQLRRLRDGLSDGSLRELSMGMSHDFHIAIEEGSTMIRLGSALFGPRGG